MHESILAFRGRRYLWLAVIMLAAALAAYLLHDPQEPPNGGTVLGYALGTLAALLVAWLGWFGIRKRRYASTMGSVQGWLSAHVYLGLVLPVIVLLHAGFQFGSNIHTLAFVLLLLVVLSGFYGVFVYAKLSATCQQQSQWREPARAVCTARGHRRAQHPHRGRAAGGIFRAGAEQRDSYTAWRDVVDAAAWRR